MRVRTAAILAMAALTLLAGCSTKQTGDALPASTPPPTTAQPTTTSAAAQASGCDYQPQPDFPSAPGRDVGLPSGSESTTGSVVLHTNHGQIKIALAGAAPCTVRSIVHLAEKKFYDGTPCHRLTTTNGLKVLQCGDPTGQGSGGPGYTIPDENPTDLKPGPNGSATYPRGVVAMANTGAPHSGGSQFFMVYGDSTIPPTYAVFGTLDAGSLAVLDAIAAAGAADGTDGPPRLGVTIQQAVVGS